jgi:glycosyltransferase involved in cell wall biosynthesis
MMKNIAAADKIPIVYVIDNFYRGGGTENQLATLIDHMDRSRFTPYVFNLRSLASGAPIDIDCDVVYLNSDSFLSISFPKAVLKIARFLKEKKVRILQLYFFDSRLVGTLAGRLAGIKPIVFCRREMGWRLSPFKRLLFKRLARLSDYCLVNARAVKEMVVNSESFPESRIEVIYNGLRLKPKEGADLVIREELGIPESAPIVGMVANLRPVKRIDRFIRIAATLKNKNAHFLIIGAGPLLEELRDLAHSLNIDGRVHFYHTVEGVHDIIGQFDIGVLTSESEGLSNVLIEYALSGIPSVAFEVGGNAEVIANDQTGFVIPDEEEMSMAERIDFLLENPDLSGRLGHAAREMAEEKFSIESMVEKAEDFYIHILSKISTYGKGSRNR